MRILMFDIDALRPDHLGCYGYPRATSPNIDRIAAQGLRFDNYYCSDGPCLPSRAALVSGRFGIHTGVVNHGGTGADMALEGPTRGFRSSFSKSSLWQLFREKNMHTASISTFAERHSAWWFNAGFNELYNVGKGGMESAEEVTPHVLNWLGRHAADDNWFLHVNYWDPHTPYRAPADFGNPFADAPLPSWHTSGILERNRRSCGGHGCREVNMWNNLEARTSDGNLLWPRHMGEIKDMHDYRKMIDGYDCGINHMDQHIGHIFAALDNQGVMDDLAIIITSDHGENLGELNCYGEHGTSDNITHRIPMIIRWPGVSGGTSDKALRYHLDLAPTIAELLDLPASSLWDGQSYAPLLSNKPAPGRDHLVLSQCCHGAMRSVRFEKFLYIRTYHDFFHLYPDEMLFDLEHDPAEENNLAPQRPDLCARGARLLLDWLESMLQPGPLRQPADPLQIVLSEGGPLHSRGELPNYLDFLKKTDRAHLVAPLKARHKG